MSPGGGQEAVPGSPHIMCSGVSFIDEYDHRTWFILSSWRNRTWTVGRTSQRYWCRSAGLSCARSYRFWRPMACRCGRTRY